MAKLSKIDRLAHYIGHVTLQWNNVQFWYFILFRTLLHDATYTAHSVFFAIRTDRAQRDMLQHLASLELEHHAELLGELKALIERGNQLAGRRNDALHAMWDFGKRGVAPHVHMPFHSRLHGKDAEEEFIGLLRKIEVLEYDLWTFYKKMGAVIRAERSHSTRKLVFQAFAEGLRPPARGQAGKAKTRRNGRKDS